MKVANTDKDAARMMRDMMGPQAVDHFIRQAISTCWAMLPEDRRSAEGVEREIRRLVDRALKDLKEDAAAFGIPGARPRKNR